MDPYAFAEIWVKCQEQLKNSFGEQVYNYWLSLITPLEMTENTCKVGVKTIFLKKYIEQNYAEVIQNILSADMGKKISLEVVAMDAPLENTEQIIDIINQPVTPPIYEKPADLFKNENNTNSYVTTANEPDESHLNPKYSFENFITGKSNLYPHAAATRVAENPGTACNPLFIYGSSGLGKTHLMHAIGNRIKRNNPNMKVLYISCEDFTNDMVETLASKRSMETFRKKYRTIDCLIIDDIQFLKERFGIQEEFFHTFNALYEANKQIVISSDRHPQEIETLTDRLRTRFKSGITADIQPPDLETRMAIIRQKSTSLNIEMPQDVVTLLATTVTTSVRELEGAFNNIVTQTSLLNLPLTLETAQQILDKDHHSNKGKLFNIEEIAIVVAKQYKINVEDLFSKKRTKNIALPRQIAIYLCRTLTDVSYPQIGEYFGGRDHSTAMHAYEKIEESRKTNSKLQKELETIIEMLK